MLRRVAVAAVVGLAAAVGVVLALQVSQGDDGVVPLARADGWRDGLGAPLAGHSAILEVAHDRETAERAWNENVPDDLPRREGEPGSPGIYRDLDDVDFGSQVVVVWSGGGSSSCPPWLVNVETDAEGRVRLETDAADAEACTDDYSLYRMLLAVARDRLPAEEELPTEDVQSDAPPPGALVTPYPADAATEPAEAAPDGARLPAELADPDTPPDPEALLPPLADHVTDDTADPGELEASLDHGAVPYVEVRRRLVLDEQGFTVGEVTVVTLEPASAGGDAYLDHRYGDVPRRPVEVSGVEMLRVQAGPFDALAWTSPTFVVTFERGGERSDQWLEGLARATVQAVAEGEP